MSQTCKNPTNRKYVDNKISNVKRTNVATMYDDTGELTTNKHAYSKSLYKAYKYILTIADKYGKDTTFCLPVIYIHNSSNISSMTIKKAINTLIRYDIIELVGYFKDKSKYAECVYKYKNRNKLIRWIEHGNELYIDSYNHKDINAIHNQLKNNTNSSKKKQDIKRIKKAINIMKNCPDLIIKFNEGNIYEDEFKQVFLLDGRFRACSHFAITKNPANNLNIDIENTERTILIRKLENQTGYKYVEQDLPSSIYTLSHYLKTKELFFDNDEYFYELVANTVKKHYGNTKLFDKNNSKEKKIVKNICMILYMGQTYNLLENDSYDYKYKHNWSIKYMTKNEKHKKKLIDTMNYFTGNTNGYYTLDDYQELFHYTQLAIKDNCLMKKSNIFLYETILCSIIIKKAADDGYVIVNAYDGFYIPSIIKSFFINKYVKSAYEEVYDIYYSSINEPIKNKTNRLFDYLLSIDKIEYIDDIPYIKMFDDSVLVDFNKPDNIIYKETT